MKYSIAEKAAILDHSPRIKIEKVEFTPIHSNDWGGFATPEICFLTEEAEDAVSYDRDVEGVQATFSFKDNGYPTEHKSVAFFGFAQIFGIDYGPENENGFICGQAPDRVFDAYADEDGRFKVTVDLYLKVEEEDEDREEWDNIMSSGEWSFLFKDMVVANQFFEEHIGSVCGGFDQDRDPIRKEYVEYGLTPDPDDADRDVSAEAEEDGDVETDIKNG
ncbi:MAG: hypothetical protein J6128_06675 [Clostridia bacterium]|nr:hypothetical protein [Clostridia bacterium]